MATMVNIYESYGDKSAKERAELIYSNYSSFQGIIEDCKMRLIYEIKAEKERKRSNQKDELGVRNQNLVTTVILQRIKRFLIQCLRDLSMD